MSEVKLEVKVYEIGKPFQTWKENTQVVLEKVRIWPYLRTNPPPLAVPTDGNELEAYLTADISGRMVLQRSLHDELSHMVFFLVRQLQRICGMP